MAGERRRMVNQVGGRDAHLQDFLNAPPVGLGGDWQVCGFPSFRRCSRVEGRGSWAPPPLILLVHLRAGSQSEAGGHRPSHLMMRSTLKTYRSDGDETRTVIRSSAPPAVPSADSRVTDHASRSRARSTFPLAFFGSSSDTTIRLGSMYCGSNAFRSSRSRMSVTVSSLVATWAMMCPKLSRTRL